MIALSVLIACLTVISAVVLIGGFMLAKHEMDREFFLEQTQVRVQSELEKEIEALKAAHQETSSKVDTLSLKIGLAPRR